MPFSPSDLEWWGWLLVAVGCAVVAVGAGAISDKTRSKALSGILVWAIAIPAGLATMLFGIIGIVRLVKWAWHG